MTAAVEIPEKDRYGRRLEPRWPGSNPHEMSWHRITRYSIRSSCHRYKVACWYSQGEAKFVALRMRVKGETGVIGFDVLGWRCRSGDAQKLCHRDACARDDLPIVHIPYQKKARAAA